jgi:hypothetical protein
MRMLLEAVAFCHGRWFMHRVRGSLLVPVRRVPRCSHAPGPLRPFPGRGTVTLRTARTTWLHMCLLRRCAAALPLPPAVRIPLSHTCNAHT